MRALLSRSMFLVNIGVSITLTLIPLAAQMMDSPFLLTIFSRIVILAMTAVSLNLILGYGGMISFGHAAFIGIGGYAVGILSYHGVGTGFIQLPAAVAASALFALITGALSLRTRGIYFIMITLAFAQMLYFVTVGIEEYGGDDGLTIYSRSTFTDWLDLSNKNVFYYVCLSSLFGSILLVWQIGRSHFGAIILGSRSNDRRMQALGISTYKYRLAAYVISGMIAGLSGALLANHTDFISPDMLSWSRSGDLIIMVVLGGVGTVFGPVVGATTYLLAEHWLSSITEHWQIFLGPFLVIVALVRGGQLRTLWSKVS